MIKLLRASSIIVLAYMVYVVVSTSVESNLFELMAKWDPENFMAPWFAATLWDFYANVFFIAIWVAYKERKPAMVLLWIILLVCLGSIATMGYLAIQLFRIDSTDNLDRLFVRNSAV